MPKYLHFLEAPGLRNLEQGNWFGLDMVKRMRLRRLHL